jgi:hypothetical protein
MGDPGDRAQVHPVRPHEGQAVKEVPERGTALA